MATVSDITTTPLSGLNHIDALLDVGPDWNYLTPAGNTILYPFSVTSGNEQGRSGQQAFTLAQQAHARTAFEYISSITGITFPESLAGSAAHIHLCNIDIGDPGISGLCSWKSSFGYGLNDALVEYDVDAYIYLDNVQWAARNFDLAPGGFGYQTLLHELGHALGLKHPFDEHVHLPHGHDHTGNTLMSYTNAGGPYTQYSQYDIAALNWIYGGDGLRGQLGLNSASGARYITGTGGNDVLTGTSHNDTLEGAGGNDMINGGDGIDTAVFRGARSTYSFKELGDGSLLVSSPTEGTVTLNSVEILHFTDRSYERAQVVDVTPPAAPTLAVTKNANGYAKGNKPLVSGGAEANATVKVYSGNVQIGTTQADANGLWTLTTEALADGMNYSIYAKAIDAAGNESAPSASVTFHVDARAPTIPTGSLSLNPGGNQPVFSGTAEAGTTIQLVRNGDFIDIAHANVGSDGKWKLDSLPLPNGNYTVSVVSVDKADNATTAAQRLSFTVSSSLNETGTAANDQFTAGTGNNAIDGRGGIDTVVYAGPRANYQVSKEVWGYSVTDSAGPGGRDTLIDVERVQFSDGWEALDVDGVAGKAYRLYQAAFDRPAEAAGLGYWIWRMDEGTTLQQVALEFTRQPEFEALYGKNPTDAEFIGFLYKNVLHREPEGAGFEFWMDAITKMNRAEVLVEFSESFENKAQVIGSIENGMDFVPWGA